MRQESKPGTYGGNTKLGSLGKRADAGSERACQAAKCPGGYLEWLLSHHMLTC